MELQGKIIACLEPKSGDSKRNEGEKWMSQDYVMEYKSGEYPRRICFNVWGEERIKRFDLKVGDQVSVSFDIDAREWNGKWFSDIRAYNVDHVVATATNGTTEAMDAQANIDPFGDVPEVDMNKLPFM